MRDQDQWFWMSQSVTITNRPNGCFTLIGCLFMILMMLMCGGCSVTLFSGTANTHQEIRR